MMSQPLTARKLLEASAPPDAASSTQPLSLKLHAWQGLMLACACVACQKSTVALFLAACCSWAYVAGLRAWLHGPQDLAAWRVSTPLEARAISERCHPCYMNEWLRGDTARMPQRGLYAPAGAPAGALLGVYDATLKTVREDAAYVNADPTCTRGMAASYTFDVPWSKTADNDGLVLVGEANGGLMGLINDTQFWWVYGPALTA